MTEAGGRGSGPGLTIETVTGERFAAHIDALARLRMTVFREYPYLYDGNYAYEQRYLRTYVEAPNAMAVIVKDGDAVIGASTGVPLASETTEFRQPFLDRGHDPRGIFYCGESVLLAAYRGRGLYRRFFDGREAFAESLGGFTRVCFCAVVRPPDHPLRPKNYTPLDVVWRHFGYSPDPELVANFVWKDIGEEHETNHPMQFWLKNLALR